MNLLTALSIYTSVIGTILNKISDSKNLIELRYKYIEHLT